MRSPFSVSALRKWLRYRTPDRQTGERRECDGGDYLVPVVINVAGVYVDAGGHDLHGRDLGKVDRGLQQLGLILVEDLLVLGRFDDGLELFDGLFAVDLLLGSLAAGEQMRQPHDKPDERLEHDRHAAHGIGIAQRERVRRLFRGDLRDRLAEDDDKQCQDHGGGPGVFVASHQKDDEHRRKGGRRDVGKVVADEDRAERVIKFLGDFYRNCGARRAVVAQIFKPHDVAGGIGHLRRRAESREREAYEDAENDKSRRHFASPPSSCAGRSATFSFRMRLCSISSTVTVRL